MPIQHDRLDARLNSELQAQKQRAPDSREIPIIIQASSSPDFYKQQLLKDHGIEVNRKPWDGPERRFFGTVSGNDLDVLSNQPWVVYIFFDRNRLPPAPAKTESSSS